ncbi:MAG: hypothetical protein IJB91_03620 [Oscillospiraceae bacterium]|nr:hypothetical protein [Oscillospiraceae bacterium]
MKFEKWLNLQLFAGEGASGGVGDGGNAGEGAATVENRADDGHQRLRELGVPESKIRKRAYNLPTKAQAQPAAKQEEQQVAAAETKPTEEDTPKATRMSWDEIMADPEYNKQMQGVIKGRLREAGQAQDALQKLTPALEIMASRFGLDVEQLDYEAISKAIQQDDSYYAKIAEEKGLDVATVRKLEQHEINEKRRKAEENRTIQQQMYDQHLQKLEQQAEEFKKTVPQFDLRAEMQNPAFVRMTAPGVGLTIQQAYNAIHYDELHKAAVQAAAQQTAQKISNAIQSGSQIPGENGISGMAPSTSTFDYRHASKEQRAALKKRIFDADARGEKVYPGQR